MHALRNVVSLRVRAGPDAFDETWHAPGMVAALNGALPASIRVTAAVRSGRKFMPRRACEGRSYIYFLPRDALGGGGGSSSIGGVGGGSGGSSGSGNSGGTADPVVALQRAMDAYVGVHPFHNFTRPRTRAEYVVRRAPAGAGAPWARGGRDAGAASGAGATSSSSSGGSSGAEWDVGSPHEWRVQPIAWRRVDAARVRAVELCGAPFLEVSLSGASFMQEQV